MKMDLNDFASWVNRAKIGENIVYHTGYLPKDRQPIVDTETGKKTLPDLSWVAARALDQCYEGILKLTQRRVGDFVYQYIHSNYHPNQ